MENIAHQPATRRVLLTAVGSFIGYFGVASTFALRPAIATPASMAAAIREAVGEAALHQGRVKLEIPPLVENGNTVSMTISVDSPMTELDHVKSIHIFNEKNPQPNVTTFHLTPRVGARAFRREYGLPILKRSSQSPGLVTIPIGTTASM
jgi:sulfur-oxidizing protein SoxY